MPNPTPSEAGAQEPPAIHLIAAHPDWRQSRVNARVFDTVRQVPGVSVNDLYARYPDYDIAVTDEQAQLAATQLLVLQFPVRWYSVPPLLKLWLDDVLTLGWAYGQSGTALRGKSLWVLASTGGPEDSYQPRGYNGHAIDDFLLPLAQTARLCGMRFVPPLVLHGANGVSEARIDEHAQLVAERLRTWASWRHTVQAADPPLLVVPGSDRPAPSPTT